VARLSAIIITRNEAENVAGCLATVAFCDERIVVDCGSTDATREVAGAAGARVVVHPFAGFGAQKNFALSLATGDWVLSIDADERVPEPLALEIAAAIARGDADGYSFARATTFLGRTQGRSGLFPDHVLRLFRRGRARFSDALVHETVICDGPVARLGGVLLHEPVRRLEDALSRVDRYSTAGAEMLVASGRRVSFMSGIWHGAWTFIRVYCLQLGFLDGREGFLRAVANAEGSYYRYMKAWLAGSRRG
jgi:glycosyltransferase involved in cell wall biosynthesis